MRALLVWLSLVSALRTGNCAEWRLSQGSRKTSGPKAPFAPDFPKPQNKGPTVTDYGYTALELFVRSITIECRGPLPVVANGRVDAFGSSCLGAVRSIRCNANYTIRGANVIACQRSRTLWDRGQWSRPGVCQKIGDDCVVINEPDEKCAFPSDINAFFVVVDDLLLGERFPVIDPVDANTIVEMHCPDGFNLSGPSKYLCAQGVGWFPQTFGRCVRAIGNATRSGCTMLPPQVPNGTWTGHSGATRSLVCRRGYRIDGGNPVTTTCLKTGEWSPFIGKCSQVDCGKPPPLENGVIENGTCTAFSVRKVRCLFALELVGEQQIVCNESGHWSEPGRCVATLASETTTAEFPSLCSRSPPQVDNGFATSDVGDSGVTWRMNCNSGFKLIGLDEIKCADSGDWIVPGVCAEIERSCDGDPFLPDGVALPGESSVGSERQLFCLGDSVRLEGSSKARCLDSGVWEVAASCEKVEPVACSDNVPLLRNGLVGAGDTAVGSERILHCNFGYRLQGPSTIRCSETGTWGLASTCARYCGDPSAPTYGFLTDQTVYVANVSCFTGFHLSGPARMVCTDSGIWTRPGKCLPDSQTTPGLSLFTVTSGFCPCVAEVKVNSTALVAASRRGQTRQVEQLLANCSDPDLIAQVQRFQLLSPLMWAARRGHTAIMDSLLACDANPDLANPAGMTALMVASKAGREDAVGLLLEVGADANLVNSKGWSALLFAAENGSANNVRQLLRMGHANMSAADESSMTALMLAVRDNHTEVVRVLIDSGVDVNVVNNRNQTALMFGARGGYLEIVRVLLDYGANLGAVDGQGHSALGLARSRGHLEVAEEINNRISRIGESQNEPDFH